MEDKIAKKILEKELTGGHPNSLGNTIKVVNKIIKDPQKINALFSCYSSNDEVVRLRTSNAFKRIFKEHPEWLKPLLNKFFTKIPKLNQPSAMWTLAQICFDCEDQLTTMQLNKAKKILKEFMVTCDDWIVQNMCIQTLGTWAQEDEELKKWLVPKLKKLSKDKRKSVSKRSLSYLKKLTEK